MSIRLNVKERITRYEPVLNKYIGAKFLGKGGYSEVYEMHHKNNDNSKVAVKIIPVSNSLGKDAVEKYKNEIRILENIKESRNTVTYKEHDEKFYEDGNCTDIIIVMELLKSLPEILKEKVYVTNEQNVIELGIDLCSALEILQINKIIHRDIKPENIFYSEKINCFKLGDFGIAKKNLVSATDTGRGSPMYIAPEIFYQEKIESGDSRCDIYSLGLVMYELMNDGVGPFLKKDFSYNDLYVAQDKRLQGEKIPLPLHATSQLSKIILKSCSFEKNERYDNPTSMKRELQAAFYATTYTKKNMKVAKLKKQDEVINSLVEDSQNLDMKNRIISSDPNDLIHKSSKMLNNDVEKNKVIANSIEIVSIINDKPHNSLQEKKLNSKNLSTSQIITVTSGRGGVGKTSFVVNLAIQLTKQNKRVLIIDACFGLANIEVMFGILPRYTIADAISRNKKIWEIIAEGPMNINFISGGCGIASLANISDMDICYIIDNLSYLDSIADIILIDTGPGISTSVTEFIGVSNEIILMITQEPTSLTDAYALLKSISTLCKVIPKISIVSNFVKEDQEATDCFMKLRDLSKKLLGINIHNLGNEPFDRAIIKSIKKQNPASISYPYAKSLIFFKDICQYLISDRMKH